MIQSLVQSPAWPWPGLIAAAQPHAAADPSPRKRHRALIAKYGWRMWVKEYWCDALTRRRLRRYVRELGPREVRAPLAIRDDGGSSEAVINDAG